MNPVHTLLVANRSEIAIRVMRAAAELGIRTVAIYSHEDRFALHRFKADESYLVGAGKKPLDAYLDIADIIRIAKSARADAIHPGYGFLSENPRFAAACAEAGLRFIGPSREVMTTLGNKVAAREAAVAAGVPVMPATGPLPQDYASTQALAATIGYPLMLKASWGGGGRGMRVIESADDLASALDAARREAKAAFGNDEVYLEKLVRRAKHVEVQILATRMATSCTSSSAIAQCSGATKRWSSARPPLTSGMPRAASCATRRSGLRVGSTTLTPARSNSCSTPTAKNSISSR